MRHAHHYTVVGNHLAQHPALSLVAIGLALHIQSLPTGAKVGIKALAERFPEGEVRIAGALRELEAHGYLERSRVRTPEGRLLTRTVSYNHPRGAAPPLPPHTDEPDPDPDPQPDPDPELDPELDPDPDPAPGAVPVLAPVSASASGIAAGLPSQEAMDLLARLRCDDPRLLLAEERVRQLAPGVAAWLERGVHPEAVRHALTAELPADLRHPAALIGYRLRTSMPPHLPAPPPVTASSRPDPLQNCDGCDRAFRAPAPGRCVDCPPETHAAVA
ncbi:helix-turn-helix domain-containing protein [Streptomyces sp. NPDC001568]|uniref:helix-turn-helix domain-containing protein n=1 Tax=Streptomyces sp. NPDC001568 TaxID=3364588 RepID=UPI0036994666